MNKTNIIIKLLMSRAFLIFLGFIFLSYYIWFRFIRERLPRNIPFDLTLISLIILFYICIMYFYLIIRFFTSKKQNQFAFEILTLFQKLRIPFILLDEYIRSNKYIKMILNKFITKSLNLIKNIVINLKTPTILETINSYIIIIINLPNFGLLYDSLNYL